MTDEMREMQLTNAEGLYIHWLNGGASHNYEWSWIALLQWASGIYINPDHGR